LTISKTLLSLAATKNNKHMKKIFPLALIATFAIFSLTTSCKKSSSSSCVCKGKSWNTHNDTTFTVAGANTAQCDTAQIVYQFFDSSMKCSIQ
jgi:hypothetical protein